MNSSLPSFDCRPLPTFLFLPPQLPSRCFHTHSIPTLNILSRNKQPKSTFLSAHPHAHSSATQSSQTYLRHAVLAYPYANEPSDGNPTFTPRIAQYCMNTLTTALARHRRWTGTREQCASHGDARRCSQMHSHVTGPLIFQSHPSRCIPLAVSSLLHPLRSSNRQSMMREWTHCLSSTSGDSRAWVFHVHPHPIPLQFKLHSLHYVQSSTATLPLPSIIHVLHFSSQSIIPIHPSLSDKFTRSHSLPSLSISF